MTRSMHRRLQRLEEIVVDSQPVPPIPILVPKHVHGTPEAEEEARAFRALHPGQRVIICRVVDNRVHR